MKDSLSGAEARRIALAAQGFAQPRPATTGTRQLNLAMARMAHAADRLRQRLRALSLHAAVLAARTLRPRRPGQASLRPPPGLRRVPGRTSPRSSPRRTGGCCGSGWTTCAPSTARSPTAGSRRTTRSSTGCAPSSPPAGRCDPRRSSTTRSRPARGPWWDWDVVKNALEYLWLFGEVAIAGRRGFERRYGLAEQVLPPDVLAAPVARDDAVRELVARAARAYGVATASDLADYWRIKDRPCA